MWELDCEEGWEPKNWCFWTVVLEKTVESPLDYKEIQPVHSKGDQPWDFFGRNDAEAETPVIWPPHAKNWLIGKDSDGGRDWGQEEKGMTEDEMAGWHHWLDGRESEWTPGVGNGQGVLPCCDSWGHSESDTTEQLDWIDACTERLLRVKSQRTSPGHMSLALRRRLHFKIHFSWGVCVHFRRLSWHQFTSEGQSKMICLKEYKDQENYPLIKDLIFPKVQFCLWACHCAFLHVLFFSTNLPTCYLLNLFLT